MSFNRLTLIVLLVILFNSSVFGESGQVIAISGGSFLKRPDTIKNHEVGFDEWRGGPTVIIGYGYNAKSSTRYMIAVSYTSYPFYDPEVIGKFTGAMPAFPWMSWTNSRWGKQSEEVDVSMDFYQYSSGEYSRFMRYGGSLAYYHRGDIFREIEYVVADEYGVWNNTTTQIVLESGNWQTPVILFNLGFGFVIPVSEHIDCQLESGIRIAIKPPKHRYQRSPIWGVPLVCGLSYK